MSESPETADIWADNFEYNDRVVGALQESTASVHPLRVLDYGTGAIPSDYGLTGRIQPDELIAYDPNMQEGKVVGRKEWTNKEPSEKNFDLIILAYSLHHMEESPEEVIKALQEKYNPRLIALMEYDYKGNTLDSFRGAFIDQQQKQELKDVFGGDEQACFDRHSRYGLQDFQSALEQNGFAVPDTRKGKGEGGAKNKIFLIGERQNAE